MHFLLRTGDIQLAQDMNEVNKSDAFIPVFSPNPYLGWKVLISAWRRALEHTRTITAALSPTALTGFQPLMIH